VDDQTLILADQAEKAVKQVREAVYDLLSPRFSEEKARELAELLSSGRWTHDYPITPQQARELGLEVSTEMPEEFMQLMNLFPQPVRRIASVEYLPERRTVDRRGTAGGHSS